MPKSNFEATAQPTDYIVPLNMNGLRGRMLALPARRAGQREILMVYGHHSSLERWFGMALVFNRCGAVTMPDLPGFGGMQSFYKIGQKPSLDQLADYLAAFVKMRYKRRRVTIVGLSFGFLVATRMLQRYPELAKKVDVVVSVLGFTHHDEFRLKKRNFLALRLAARLLALRGVAFLFRTVGLNRFVLRQAYIKNDSTKFKDVTPDVAEQMLQIEIGLWQTNDVRTRAYTATAMFTADNTLHHIDLPVWHIHTKGDHFFNNVLVEAHLRRIYSSYDSSLIDLSKHAPTVMATAKDVEPYVPARLRRALSKKPA